MSDDTSMADKNAAIAPSDRIRDLSSIDAEVPKLLRSASLAIQSLTGTPPSDTDEEDMKDASDAAESKAAREIDVSAARGTFDANNTAFLHTLQALGARLRRQAYALEEAGIVSSEAADAQPTQEQPARGQQGQIKASPQITNGGLGSLDVGWLNSRRDDVARGKEAELWMEAKTLLEKHAEKQTDSKD